MSWRVIIQNDFSRMVTDLVIIAESASPSERLVVKPWVLDKVDRGMLTEPTYRMDEGQIDGLLQAFADAAWEHGIRPRQIEDQRNQVKAMESHLTDLRKIAFKTLKVETS